MPLGSIDGSAEIMIFDAVQKMRSASIANRWVLLPAYDQRSILDHCTWNQVEYSTKKQGGAPPFNSTYSPYFIVDPGPLF